MHDVIIGDLYDFFILSDVVDYVSAIVECYKNEHLTEYGDENASVQLDAGDIIKTSTNCLGNENLHRSIDTSQDREAKAIVDHVT